MEVLGSEGFYLGVVEVASTPWRRTRGLMGRDPVPLLVAASMVHGFWLREPLWVVGVDACGVVTDARLLNKRGLVRLRAAVWTLELPLGSNRPRVGERLAFRKPDGEAERHVGPPLPLFHADREPG